MTRRRSHRLSLRVKGVLAIIVIFVIAVGAALILDDMGKTSSYPLFSMFCIPIILGTTWRRQPSK